MVEESILQPEERKIANWVIKKSEKTFSWTDEERGRFKEEYIPPYKIPTIAHTPWRDRPIPIPPAAVDQITAKIQDKIKTGVYEPSQGSYLSSIFVVKKKDGDYRFVHNMQTLNSVTVRDNATPPLLENYADEFAGLSCVGLLDLYDGYGQYPLHEDSRDLTAFQTRLGPMRLTTLPQGASNSVGVFQRAANFITGDENPPTAVAYLDDFGIKGPRTKYENANGVPATIPENPGVRRYVYEYLQALHRLLWKMGKYGGTFSGKKVRLCDDVLTIVGFSCSYFGRKPTDTSVKKITTWPKCQNVKEVRGFLGTVGPARNWIRNYAVIARPLVRLTAGKIQDKDFVWTDEADEAFARVKDAVRDCGWMRPIDYSSSEEIYLAVDSSHIAVGFEIGQDDKGKKRPARFGSITFSERESRYSQAKLELFGVFKALKKCSHWIYGRSVRLEVDAKYLIEMINAPELPNSAMTRWLWYIHMFDLHISHVPANKHAVVDGLSRRRPVDEDTDEDDAEEWLDRTCGVAIVDRESDLAPLSPKVYLIQDYYDDDWKLLGKYLETGELGDISATAQRRLRSKALYYFVRNGKLYRRIKNEMLREVLGTQARRLHIMEEAHVQGGHKGALSLKHQVGLRFFWPGMSKDTEHFVKSCDLCQRRDPRRFEEENQSTYPSDVGSIWGVDLVTMPPSGGFRYIIIAREDLSKWVEAKAIRKKEASQVAKFLMERIITRYGWIKLLKSDQGSEFMGEVTEILARFKVKHIRTSPYHPQANGVVERGNGPFKEALYRTARELRRPWHELVDFASWAERTTHSRTTGYTPYRLMMGQDCILPFDLEEATFLVRGLEDGCSREELLAHRIRQLLRRETDLDIARERLAISREVSVNDHNRKNERRMKEAYKEGDWVLLRDSSLDVTYQTKEPDRWFGPYIIVERTRGRAYKIREIDGTMKSDLVSHTRLRPYYRRDDLLERQNDDIEEEDGLLARDDEDVVSIERHDEEMDVDEEERLFGWARGLDEPLPPNNWIPRHIGKDLIHI